MHRLYLVLSYGKGNASPEAEVSQAVVLGLLRQLLRQVLELVGGHICAHVRHTTQHSAESQCDKTNPSLCMVADGHPAG